MKLSLKTFIEKQKLREFTNNRYSLREILKYMLQGQIISARVYESREMMRQKMVNNNAGFVGLKKIYRTKTLSNNST